MMRLGIALVVCCGCAHAPGGNDLSVSDLAVKDAAPRDCGLDVAGTLADLVTGIVTAMRAHGGAGSNAVVLPSASVRDAFAATVLALLGGDDAAACALPPSYRLVRVAGLRAVAEVDATGTPSPSLFWGSYVAATPTPSRQLLVEAPHPLFDLNTAAQAADLFVKVSARYLAIAGGHRCADDGGSGCSGTTDACGPVENYKISDAAHSVTLPFYAVHAQLSDAHPQLAFLQLHGNGAACPSALVADGSGAWPDGGTAVAMAKNLESGGVTVGRCGVGYPTAGCTLCATDNVEARYSAGAGAGSCTQLGTQYGRMVHIEQLISLRQNAAAWQPLVDAILASYPAN